MPYITEDKAMDNQKKRQIKKVIGWVCLALIVAFLAVNALISGGKTEKEGQTASILSGRVTTGDIATVIRGGGTLTQEAAVQVRIPDAVQLTEFLVADGDAVAQGEIVAMADPVSVSNAIVQVQQTLEELKKEMQLAADDQASDRINALAGGRVKQVFCQSGDSVQQVMLEHGALAVLSLDGLMAVDLTAQKGMAAGVSVTVVFSDGSIADGRVESALAQGMTVTMEDNGYEPGQSVQVYSGEQLLGSGTLYIHNAWKAVAYCGTVHKVNVKAESAVSPGKTLITLKDTANTAAFDLLTEQYRAYHGVLQELLLLYQQPAIRAPGNGIVCDVEENCLYTPEKGSPAAACSTERQSILSLIPQNTMTLTFPLDEQDLGKIQPGQKALVSVPALGDEKVEATVTNVGTRGSNRGGSSKFTVELTLPRNGQMLPGMSATASITLSVAKGVQLIPVAALWEEGAETVVYTACNPRTGELTHPVAVTLGVSDGIHVQVLSALAPGDTYYYAYFDTLQEENGAP